MMDYYGNISMTLSGTGCYLDIDKYLNNGIVAPAFVADMQANGLDPNEACSKACFDWYKDYAQANIDHQQPFTRDDSVVVSIAAEKPSFTIMPNGSLPINSLAESTAWPKPSGFFCRMKNTFVISEMDFTISRASSLPLFSSSSSSSTERSK